MADLEHASLYGSQNHRPLGANNASGTDQPLILTSYARAIQWAYAAGITKPAFIINASGTTGPLPSWSVYANLYNWLDYSANQLAYLIADGGSGRPELGVLGDIDVNGAKISNDAASLYIDRSGFNCMIVPRLTTAIRDSIASMVKGAIIYNTTTDQFETYNGSSWVLFGTAGTLDDCYNSGGAGAGATITTANTGAVIIDQTGNDAEGLIVRADAGQIAQVFIGAGSNDRPENRAELWYDDAVGALKILLHGSGVGDTNEGVMIEASDDRSAMAIGNATDVPDLDLRIAKLRLNSTDPGHYQVPTYNSATGRMVWKRGSQLQSEESSASTPIAFASTGKNHVVSTYAGDREVDLPAANQGVTFAVTNRSGATRTLTVYAGGSASMFDGAASYAHSVQNYETITWVLGGDDRWYVLSRGIP